MADERCDLCALVLGARPGWSDRPWPGEAPADRFSVHSATTNPEEPGVGKLVTGLYRLFVLGVHECDCFFSRRYVPAYGKSKAFDDGRGIDFFDNNRNCCVSGSWDS